MFCLSSPFVFTFCVESGLFVSGHFSFGSEVAGGGHCAGHSRPHTRLLLGDARVGFLCQPAQVQMEQKKGTMKGRVEEFFSCVYIVVPGFSLVGSCVSRGCCVCSDFLLQHRSFCMARNCSSLCIVLNRLSFYFFSRYCVFDGPAELVDSDAQV